ncbi:MAG: biotin--[acetyl-CoA-carboxylase] ligase, partial [Solirubrobacterales bacterium]
MPWPGAEPTLDAELTRAFTPCLPGGRLAGPLRAYRSLASTQTLTRAWATAGAPEGAVVLADHQTAGRGQHGRAWTAPAGTALLFSVVLRPRLPVARWPEIPLAAGCAVAEGLETVAPVSARLKWPNDV